MRTANLTESEARATVAKMSLTAEQKGKLLDRWIAGDKPTRFVVYGVSLRQREAK